VECRRDVSWDPPRRHQHGVEADVLDTRIGKPREPCLGCGNDAGALTVGDRPGRIIEVLARLYFDEDQERTPARDDVDLAHAAAPAPRQDAKPLGQEKRRRAALRRDAGAERDLAFGAWTLHRRRTGTLIGHRRAPPRAIWRAPARVDRPRGAARR